MFAKGVLKLHGTPNTIVSDRDPSGSLFYYARYTIVQKHCPRLIDGQTSTGLWSGERPTNWLNLLPWAEWWYNTTYHSAIRMSPFQALYYMATHLLQCKHTYQNRPSSGCAITR